MEWNGKEKEDAPALGREVLAADAEGETVRRVFGAGDGTAVARGGRGGGGGGGGGAVAGRRRRRLPLEAAVAEAVAVRQLLGQRPHVDLRQQVRQRHLRPTECSSSGTKVRSHEVRRRTGVRRRWCRAARGRAWSDGGRTAAVPDAAPPSPRGCWSAAEPSAPSPGTAAPARFSFAKKTIDRK